MNQKQRKKGMKYVLLLAGILLLLSSSVESQAAARKPNLSKKKLHMTVGKQERLSVKNKKGYVVSWKSNKKAVATVSKTGKIKAKKSGSAKITAIAKPSQDGKSYRLVCKVSVKKGKAADSGKRSGQQGNSSVGSKENSSPAVSPEVGSVSQDPATSGQVPGLATSAPIVSDLVIPAPAVSDAPISNLATPAPAVSCQPLPNLPAVPATGSAVADGELKLLFGNYNDGLLDGDFFGNRMIDSYEQLQSLLHETKEEMGNVTWQGGCDRLQWYINQLETIGQDYFTDHVLCINTMMVARGYDYTLDYAVAVVEEDGTKALQLCLGRHYSLKDGECVTCDMPYYSYFIQLPRELVQDCKSVVCSLVSGGVVVPSGKPEYPYMMQGVLRILDQVCYPIS
ncbi:MAG: Ig-like domain-containing protein [Lachnospiraceae bacterium]|nr:Ig-like domain-containing protein [Lachnospiraceae bacterium]